MKTILQALALCFVALPLLAADAPKPSVFQLRLVRDASAADTEQMVLPPIAKRGESPVDEVLHVQKSTLIDHRAIRSAYVNTNYIAGYVVIGIEFSQQGKELLAKLTTENIGKRVAILIDGKLQSAPRIPSPITGGSIVVQGPFTVEEAQVLVGKIKRETSK